MGAKLLQAFLAKQSIINRSRCICLAQNSKLRTSTKSYYMFEREFSPLLQNSYVSMAIINGSEWLEIYGPGHAKMFLMAYANNKGADQRESASLLERRCLLKMLTDDDDDNGRTTTDGRRMLGYTISSHMSLRLR